MGKYAFEFLLIGLALTALGIEYPGRVLVAIGLVLAVLAALRFLLRSLLGRKSAPGLRGESVPGPPAVDAAD